VAIDTDAPDTQHAWLTAPAASWCVDRIVEERLDVIAPEVPGPTRLLCLAQGFRQSPYTAFGEHTWPERLFSHQVKIPLGQPTDQHLDNQALEPVARLRQIRLYLRAPGIRQPTHLGPRDVQDPFGRVEGLMLVAMTVALACATPFLATLPQHLRERLLEGLREQALCGQRHSRTH
jgi:hypothetical protein